MTARIAVVITGSSDREAAAGSVRSIREAEEVETHVAEAETASAARVEGLDATSAPFVLFLTAGDLLNRAVLGPLADALESAPGAGSAYGDRADVDGGIHVRRVPPELDEFPGLPPVRLPLAALFRRQALVEQIEAAGENPLADAVLWRGLADRGVRGVHLGEDFVTCVRPREAGAVTQRRRRRLLAASSFRPLESGEPEQLELLIESARRPDPEPAGGPPRVAVLTPCFNDGRFVGGAVDSIAEREPIEVVIVDDHSTDEETVRVLAALRRQGAKVIRLEGHAGLAAARNRALAESSARYVFPLDADDFALPGVLGRLADVLDADPEVGVAYGDIEEISVRGHIMRDVPLEIDPFRLAYANKMPLGAMYRRELIEPLGGWTDPDPDVPGYEDWDLWMSLAEAGVRGRHLGRGTAAYGYRIQARRLTTTTRRSHPRLYQALRERHPELFRQVDENRSRSDLGALRKSLYPLVFGGRRRVPIERPIKRTLDRLSTLTPDRR